jgi:predicted dehydrogenase
MISFGTLGAANITPQALIYPCINEPNATIKVIAARDKQHASDFAKYHQISRVVDSYDQVVNHESCNALYNPLPISLHKNWTIEALKAGKHVLCEKSLACNEEEAAAMAQVAKSEGLILMDAFHYRYHPLFKTAKRIYDDGSLGEIQEVSAIFSIAGTPSNDDIRMNYETAGGVTMDIGCYPISWLRHLTGQEPEVVSATAETGPKYVDLMLEANFMIGNIKGSIMGDMRANGKFAAEIRVNGERGSMIVRNPLAPHMGHVLETEIDGKREFLTVDRRTTYCYQLDAFMEAVQINTPPITDGEDAVKQMRVIDQCYLAAGLPIRGKSHD